MCAGWPRAPAWRGSPSDRLISAACRRKLKRTCYARFRRFRIAPRGASSDGALCRGGACQRASHRGKKFRCRAMGFKKSQNLLGPYFELACEADFWGPGGLELRKARRTPRAGTPGAPLELLLTWPDTVETMEHDARIRA